MSRILRLEMPGNPRYQPKSLIPYFGYDNLARFLIEVEWALLESLADIKVIPEKEAKLLTYELKELLTSIITTTVLDEREKITKHDIRALVQLMQENMPEPLRKWVHYSATSYDVIENARIIAYKRAFREVTLPTLVNLIKNLSAKAEGFASVVQIGRTHGQHALPITVGFWLATLLNRFVDSAQELKEAESKLVGKFSGAVGAYNAQVALGLDEKSQELFNITFEQSVMSKLDLNPGTISTQILQPNHLARFLHEHLLMSGNLAQFGRDCRHLQRTEISEIAEKFALKQVGSSTMAQKRNPISFENTEGLFEIVKAEYLKVLSCLISEHQRDLVGSSVMREFPTIVVMLQHQLERMDRVIPNMIVDTIALEKNFDHSEKSIMAEPLYLILQLYGYEGDAHDLVNHTLIPRAKSSDRSLTEELIKLSLEDQDISKVISQIPEEMFDLLHSPCKYIGRAETKTMEVVKKAKRFCKRE
ncbi:MAG: lyase family protein [Patescibacteria group bacterium]|nr:lyase family protein [Patescibacteria group bacterium]